MDLFVIVCGGDVRVLNSTTEGVRCRASVPDIPFPAETCLTAGSAPPPPLALLTIRMHFSELDDQVHMSLSFQSRRKDDPSTYASQKIPNDTVRDIL